MEHNDLESTLGEFRDAIPVNHALKSSLKGELAMTSRSGVLGSRGLFRKAACLCAVAALALLLVVPRLGGGQVIDAASLNVYNHISFLNLGGGQGLGVTVHDDTLYVPIFGQGIFAYDDKGFTLVSDYQADWARVSPDGTRLAVSSSGTVSILDIDSGQVTPLLQSDGNTFYEEPSWSSDGKRIIYTAKVVEFGDRGHSVKTSEIWEIGLDTRETKCLATGSYASYVKGSDAIVYEDGGKIVIKNLHDGREIDAGDGRFPSVDPKGRLIAYVKVDTFHRQLTDFASAQEVLANVWIADVVNPATSKQVTSNFLHRHTDEETWLSGLEPSQTPQVLGFSGAFYYYNPVWSSDSSSIFVLKNSVLKGDRQSNMQITRVELSPDSFSPKDVVDRYIQALIKRDEDYARSLMKEPGDCSLTMSNPRQVGYTVLSSGTEQGEAYVDAEVYWQYTALPYYEVVKSRFYLCGAEGEFMIDRITEVSKLEVYEKKGTVYLETGDETTVLLDEAFIPSHFPQATDYRLSSLVYHQGSHDLVMAVQMTNGAGKEQVWIAVYNADTSDFYKVAEIGEERANPGVSKLTVDSGGRYVAADCFYQDDSGIKSDIYMFDLLQKTNVDSLGPFAGGLGADSATVSFWNGEHLWFEVQKSGQTAAYVLKPGHGGPSSAAGRFR